MFPIYSTSVNGVVYLMLYLLGLGDCIFYGQTLSRKERVVSPTKALEEKVISGGRSLVEKWLSLSGNGE